MDGKSDLIGMDDMDNDNCYSLSPPDSGSLPISPASTSPSSYHSSGGEDLMDCYPSIDILQQASEELLYSKDDDYEICSVSGERKRSFYFLHFCISSMY